MRTLILAFFLFLSTGLFFACGGPEGEKVEATDAVEDTKMASSEAVVYTVDTQNSVINWTGSKPTGAFHRGIVRLQSGNLAVENGQLVAGEFIIDMKSIEDQDLTDPGKKSQLEGHLASDDFFGVEQFPTSKFAITNIVPVQEAGITHRVEGNLTMRDITKAITIPANIAISANTVSVVTPAFNIDRTQWNVAYNSSIWESMTKDNFINDEINLVIDLKASRQEM